MVRSREGTSLVCTQAGSSTRTRIFPRSCRAAPRRRARWPSQSETATSSQPRLRARRNFRARRLGGGRKQRPLLATSERRAPVLPSAHMLQISAHWRDRGESEGFVGTLAGPLPALSRPKRQPSASRQFLGSTDKLLRDSWSCEAAHCTHAHARDASRQLQWPEVRVHEAVTESAARARAASSRWPACARSAASRWPPARALPCSLRNLVSDGGARRKNPRCLPRRLAVIPRLTVRRALRPLARRTEHRRAAAAAAAATAAPL